MNIVIVVIALGAWGKAGTYEKALAKCVTVGGRQNAQNLHLVYACSDPDCTVNDRGCIEYRSEAALIKVLAVRHGRIMAHKE